VVRAHYYLTELKDFKTNIEWNSVQRKTTELLSLTPARHTGKHTYPFNDRNSYSNVAMNTTLTEQPHKYTPTTKNNNQ
jgi:hypothetical protein